MYTESAGADNDCSTDRRARALSMRYPWTPEKEAASVNRSWKHRLVSCTALLAMVVIPGYLGYLGRVRLIKTAIWLRGLNIWGMALFVVFMAIWTVLCLPVTPLEVTAGILYPMGPALIVSTIGQVLGGILSFLFGRYCIEGWLYRKFVLRFRFMRKLRSVMKRQRWHFALLISFSYTPAYFHNFGLAVLPCSFCEYLTASLLAAAVYSMFWSSLGRGSVSVLDNINKDGNVTPGAAPATATAELVPMLIGACAALLFLFLVGQQSAKELQQLEDGSYHGDESVSNSTHNSTSKTSEKDRRSLIPDEYNTSERDTMLDFEESGIGHEGDKVSSIGHGTFSVANTGTLSNSSTAPSTNR